MKGSLAQVILLLVFGFSPGTVSAESLLETVKIPVIQVQGEATITVSPDHASMEISVVTHAKTAAAAATRNSKKMNSVIKKLKKILGNQGKIKTIGYSVRPIYKTAKKGKTKSLEGFSAVNTIQVDTNDLGLVGRLFDIATGSGANRVDRLEFTLEEDAVSRKKVLGLAARRAKSKAEAIARSLSLRIIRVLRVEEMPMNRGSSVRKFRSATTESLSVPLESGVIEMSSSLLLTVEIGERK